MTRSRLAPIVALPLLLSPAAGTRAPAWEQRDRNGPPSRIISAIAFDETRSRVVLFGGDRLRSTPTGDTWEWDGAVWQWMDSTGPSPRFGHALIYDSARKVTLLFGGYDKRDTLFGDTWTWDGTRWRALGVTGPSPRRSPGIAYDRARARVVLFGGFAGLPAREYRKGTDRFESDTWEWDGTQWSRVATTGPSPRYGGLMVYDEARHAVVLFGGNDHSGHIYGDTWTWDGRSWTRLAADGPNPRGGAPMAYDPASQTISLFGGFAADTVFQDTWVLRGSSWARVGENDVPALIFPALTQDSRRRRLVLVGQAEPSALRVETWERGY